jgi:hypothetical protein
MEKLQIGQPWKQARNSTNLSEPAELNDLRIDRPQKRINIDQGRWKPEI